MTQNRWLAALVLAAVAGACVGCLATALRAHSRNSAELAAARAELRALQIALERKQREPAPPATPSMLAAAPDSAPRRAEPPLATSTPSAPESAEPVAGRSLPDLARTEREIARLKAQQDEAMVREGERLVDRMQATTDTNELAILVQLEAKMTALETAQTKMEQATTDADKAALTGEIQQLIGAVLQLNQADRQYRLTELARSLGLEDAAAVARLMQETETIFRETQRDLAPVFSHGGPFHPAAPEPFRTTPPPGQTAYP